MFQEKSDDNKNQIWTVFEEALCGKFWFILAVEAIDDGPPLKGEG